METLTPWLLLMVAALIVACVSLYYQLRQVESQSRGQQTVLSDELRDAEAALLSALDRLREMDQTLARREERLSGGGERSLSSEAVPSSSIEDEPVSRTGVEGVVRQDAFVNGGGVPGTGTAVRSPLVLACAGGEHEAIDSTRPHSTSPTGQGAPSTSLIPGSPGPPELGRAAREAAFASGAPWRERVVALGRAGLMPAQIARELALPVGQVELALSLAIAVEAPAAG